MPKNKTNPLISEEQKDIDKLVLNHEQSISNTETPDGISPDEVNKVIEDAKLTKESRESPFTAVGVSLASALSFGLSGKVLDKSGIVSSKKQQRLRETSPIISTGTEVLGTVGSLLVPGTGQVKAAGLLGKGLKAASVAAAPIKGVVKVGQKVENITTKGLEKILAETGNKSIAIEILKKTIPKAAGSAVEGAAFSTGELIKEEALGTAEFNAENIVSSLGTGALIGGSIGGVFSAIPLVNPIVTKIKDKTTGKTRSLTKKFIDPEEAAMDISNLTNNQIISITKKDKNFKKELPNYIRNLMNDRPFNTSKDFAKHNALTLEKNGKTIGDILEVADDVSVKNPNIILTNEEFFTDRIIPTLDDFIAKHDLPGAKSRIGAVKSLRKEFINEIETNRFGFLKPTNLQKIRQALDENIDFTKKPSQFTLKEKASLELRDLFKQEIEDVAERIGTITTNPELQGLLPKLRQANRDYHIGKVIENPLEKSALKETSFLSLKDGLLGGGAFFIDPTLGAITAGVSAFARSNFKRQLTLLATVEKRNQVIQRKIDKSIKNFFKTPKGLKTLTIKSLTDSKLANKQEDGKKTKAPKNKKEAFNNIQKNINNLITNPEKLQDQLVRTTVGLSIAAPKTASAAQNTLIRALNFLNSKMPLDTSTALGGLKSLSREYEPSSIELAKFERYVGAVEDPLSVMDDLENGTITREQIEAIQNVYPDLYGRIQEATMEKLGDPETKVSYNQKIRLGILLDIPADTSLVPENISGLQASFAAQDIADDQQVEESRIKSTQTGVSGIDIAEREQTSTQRAQTRG